MFVVNEGLQIQRVSIESLHVNGLKAGRLMLLCIALCAALLGGCATHVEKGSNETVEKQKDPYEHVNRKIFGFNMWVDRWFLRPATLAYKAVTPDPVERGVSNFFDNLAEPKNIVNDVLQGKWKQAGNDSMRLTINTIGGLGGLIDVASEAGIEQNAGEDFGQTLRAWGVKSGPYIVLPFLGPSTGVDTLSLPADWVLDPVNYVDDVGTGRGLWAMHLLDLRAGLLSVDDLVSGDRYIFVREAYMQNRDFLFKDGEIEDDFGGDLEGFDDF